jgi:microcystin-dependent protein
MLGPSGQRPRFRRTSRKLGSVAGLDYRGVVRATHDSLGGAAANRLAGVRLGQIGGEQNHVLSEAEMPYHTHSVYDPGHQHVLPLASLGLGGSGPGNLPQVQDNAMQTFAAATGVQINFSGGNAAHNNVQPTRPVTTLIKL